MPIPQVSKEYIAIAPDYCCGKPRIVGTRMPVATIAKMHLEMGESLEVIASEYNLSKVSFVGWVRRGKNKTPPL